MGRNLYSVSSHYVGLELDVLIYQDHLELWYRGECLEGLPRLFGQGKEHIDFRHVIEAPPFHRRYVQCLGAVAQRLARDCGAPEVWDKLCGNPDSNPLMQWDRWFGELPARMERLEYEALIAEAKSFPEKAKTLRGGVARQHEALL